MVVFFSMKYSRYIWSKMSSNKSICCGLNPKSSVLLIAIIDTIICLIAFLLCSLALSDLHKVSTYIQRDNFDIGFVDTQQNEIAAQNGINKFKKFHSEVLFAIFASFISFLLGLGLFIGAHKNYECLVKTWLVYSCTLILLCVISSLVLMIITSHVSYLALNFLVLIRIYELCVVFEYLRVSSRSLQHLTRTPSAEPLRFHNV